MCIDKNWTIYIYTYIYIYTELHTRLGYVVLNLFVMICHARELYYKATLREMLFWA